MAQRGLTIDLPRSPEALRHVLQILLQYGLISEEKARNIEHEEISKKTGKKSRRTQATVKEMRMNNETKNSTNQNSAQKPKSPWGRFKTFIRRINIIFAPLYIISYLRELGENIDFVFKNPIISFILFVLFASVFIITIWDIIKKLIIKIKKFIITIWKGIKEKIKQFIITIWGKIKVTNLGKIIEAIINFIKSIFPPKIVVSLTVFTSLIALILISVALFNFHIKGVYYAQISSFRTEKAAVEELLSINKILINKGEKDYRARAYKAKKGYIVTFGQFYFKEESAAAAFAKAKDLLGNRVDDKAGVISSAEKSLFRRIKLFLKKIF